MSKKHEASLGTLALGAMGIVYGDIGTSPLYAIKESFHHGLAVTPTNVLGIVSMIIWSLILVVSFKYLIVVLQADYDGEGGILALMMLVRDTAKEHSTWLGGMVAAAGIFGATLLVGDGMITPAISVLSAIEGLKVATPLFEPYVIPITVGILIALFALQYRGTGSVGALFGPVCLVWFTTLGGLGIKEIIYNLQVFRAFNPYYAYAFFAANGLAGTVVLGAVFLVVTGGEALYADLAHFGARPIRLSWFCVVLPGLLLNYMGQGALLLRNPEAVENPFYHMAPGYLLYPLVGIATAATIIASQAVITGVFSLTLQGIQLDYLPRLTIKHTSAAKEGQIYIAAVNWILLICTVGLVLGFQSSTGLAAAYGVAVSTTMLITTALLYLALIWCFDWENWYTLPLIAFFLVIDLAFFLVLVGKIPEGGWFPLVVSAVICLIVYVWSEGLQYREQLIKDRLMDTDEFMQRLDRDEPYRAPGTAVYMTTNTEDIPRSLYYNFEQNNAVHEQVILLTFKQADSPYVENEDRYEQEDLENNIHRIIAHYGFMEKPDVPETMALVDKHDNGIDIDLDEISYVLGGETLVPASEIGMAKWKATIFAWLNRNATPATQYFNVPPEHTIEIGTRLKI